MSQPALPDPIDVFVRGQLEGGHCPGLLLHVEAAGQVLLRRSAGRVRPESDAPMHEGVRFRIASLTKPMVTVAALMLVDEQRLALDAPLAEVLPELGALRLADGRAPQRPPTVRDLMRHTSGLAYPFEVPQAALRERLLGAGFTPALAGLDSATFLARLAQLPLVAEPGTAFRYGYSTDVLGCIVERLEGCTLGQALARRLFGPLGMAHTGFEIGADAAPDDLAGAMADDKTWHAQIPPIGRRTPGEPWMASGGGGLLSTLDDCARFGRWLANAGGGGEAPGQRLLSQALIAELSRNQLADGVDGPAAYCGPGFGFGLGMAVRLPQCPAAMPCQPGELVWSGISGTALFVHPARRWFAVLMAANMASRMMSRMLLRHALERC